MIPRNKLLLKQSNAQSESAMVVAKAGGRGKGEMLLNGLGAPVPREE